MHAPGGETETSEVDGTAEIFRGDRTVGRKSRGRAVVRWIVIGYFVLLALVGGQTVIAILRSRGLPGGLNLLSMLAVPMAFVVIGGATAVLLAFRRALGWYFALAVVIFFFIQQFGMFVLERDVVNQGTGWSIWFAVNLVAAAIICGRGFRGVYDISPVSFRNTFWAVIAVSIGLMFLLQGL